MAIFGAQPYGVGTPTVAQDGGGSVAVNPYSGEVEGSRRIDPRTKDYVIDSTTGRILGMTNTQQLVLMAINTEKGSSAMQALGHELRTIDRITTNFERRVDTVLRAAVSHLVRAELIEVQGTEVVVLGPGRAFARLLWRDTESGVEDSTDTGV